jgi:hypothetical protein
VSADQEYLVELVAYDPALPGTRTLYFASSPGKATSASDTPAATYFEPRIIEPVNFTRTAFADARVLGGASVGYGELVLNNADQGLSALMDYGLDGRALTVRVGARGGAYPGGYTTFLTGTMEQPEVNAQRATIRLRDKLAIFDLPIQSTKYGGTNSLPAGLDGTSDDLQGKPKPLCFGLCYYLSPPCVNTARLIYQIHDGAIQEVVAVYDMGVALTFNAARADQAALEANAPPAGTYDTCLSLGFIRLGAIPAGAVTCTARGSASGGYVSTVSAIVQRILTSYSGVAGGDVDTASFSALASAAPQEVGIYLPAETTRREAIEALLLSIGAWLAPDRDGQWKIAQLVAPTGTAAATFTDAEIYEIERQATQDPARGLPAYRWTLRWRRHWTVQAADQVAGSVAPGVRAELGQEWRERNATDATVQTKHLLSPPLNRNTLLTSASDAVAEAARLLALHKVRRDYVRVVVDFDAVNAALDLGSIVSVQTDRLGYSAGRLFVVVGITSDGASRRLTLELWG